MAMVEVHASSSLLFECLYDINTSLRRIERRVAMIDDRVSTLELKDKSRKKDMILISRLKERLFLLEREVGKDSRFLRSVDERVSSDRHPATRSACFSPSTKSFENISYGGTQGDAVTLSVLGEGQGKIGACLFLYPNHKIII